MCVLKMQTIIINKGDAFKESKEGKDEQMKEKGN